MNRDILFRGKRKDHNEWVEGDLQQDKDLETMYISGFEYYQDEEGQQRDAFCYEVDPETVGEYTGLDDKNGTRIFEGDVLKDSRGTIFVVEWEKEGRFLGFTVEPERKIIYVNKVPKAEIIGNIHDNPELGGER